jgi:hypothetical protein
LAGAAMNVEHSIQVQRGEDIRVKHPKGRLLRYPASIGKKSARAAEQTFFFEKMYCQISLLSVNKPPDGLAMTVKID